MGLIFLASDLEPFLLFSSNGENLYLVHKEDQLKPLVWDGDMPLQISFNIYSTVYQSEYC